MNQLAVAVDGLSAARRKFNFRGEEHNFPGFRLGLKMGKIPTNEEIGAIIPVDSSAAANRIREEMSTFGLVAP